MRNKSLLLLLLTAICSLSCKKEDNSPSGLLTSKPWKRAYMDQTPSFPGNLTSLYMPLTDCNKDDVFRFKKDGKLEVKTGKQHCNPKEQDTEKMDYTMDFENKTMTINGNLYIIVDLSETQLKVYGYMPSYGGNNRLVEIYEH